MMKRLKTLSTVLLLASLASAQTNTAVATETDAASTEKSYLLSPAEQNSAWKKATLLYSVKAYAEAIPYFEKAMQADSTNKSLLEKLGECYRMTNNTQGKLLCYGGLVKTNQAEPIHELYYGQALAENGEAEKAKVYFERYSADSRGKNLASSASKMKQYSRNSDAYNVTPLPYNSDQSDICAVKYYNAVVFASTRSKTSWINRKHGWTKGSYLKIYATDKDENGMDRPPVLFMGDLDSKFNDGPISFSKDFSTVYFTRNNSFKQELAADGTYKLGIFVADIDMNGFSTVDPMPFNNKDYNSAHPSIGPDAVTLYFASDMPGGQGGMDLYVCRRDSFGNWSPPRNLGDKVNTAGNEVFPFIGSNGNLYFSSDGHDGLGGLDIYETRIKDGNATKVYNMGFPVNSNKDDFGIWLAEDNKTGFISSNRKAGGMDDDIYDLQVLREVRRGKEVTIVVKDKTSQEPVSDVKVVVNSDTLMTGPTGTVSTYIEEDTRYKIDAIKPEYFAASDSVSTSSSPEDSFSRELTIEKDPKLFLRALIRDANNNALLEGVTIKLTDLSTNQEIDLFTTTAEGDYFKFLNSNRIGDKLTYLIRLEKPGYLQRTVIFSHTISKPGEVNMNEIVNLTLGKVEVGMDLAKMIDLKPIYFDLGKSVIRNDAAVELDKIVQVMNEYPNMSIELGSHTDCRNSAAANLKLSSKRANASVSYIVKKGISKSRITGKGYGESRLLNNCACEGKVKSDCPEAEHDKNRRTEFVITRLK